MGKKGSRTDSRKEEFIEWTVAALGMVLLSGALGVIIYRAITQESTPPALSVIVESIAPSAAGYHVAFKVHNYGSQTAAAVVIEAELIENGKSVEKSTSALAYSPANSVRRGGMYFQRDPNLFTLNIRALGFEHP